ncbi:MAG: O-antigen ligase family protein, partial [Synergistaceae bacterium]|nr:O-antigen ligase family protein [Synergistaceae bacterium]
MKKDNKTQFPKKDDKSPLLKKIPDKYTQLPLVPSWILVPLWLVSLALPNLIYSGILFADTLHILKWTVTGVPIAIA